MSKDPKVVVSTRFAPEVAKALVQLQPKLQEALPDQVIKDRGDVVRTLVAVGLETVQTRAATTRKPPLSQQEYALRAAGLMEALGDLLLRMESHDPAGAVVLSDGLSKTMTAYTRDLKKRVK